MKYKVGNKVKIKTWKEMEKEYGLNQEYDMIPNYPCFIRKQEKELNKLNSDRVLTIKKERRGIDSFEHEIETYKMEEIEFIWSNKMIQCLASDYAEVKEYKNKILNRYEILDLRGYP